MAAPPGDRPPIPPGVAARPGPSLRPRLGDKPARGAPSCPPAPQWRHDGRRSRALLAPCSGPPALGLLSDLARLFGLERATGIEPVTSSLGSWHSTAELRPLVVSESKTPFAHCQTSPTSGLNYGNDNALSPLALPVGFAADGQNGHNFACYQTCKVVIPWRRSPVDSDFPTLPHLCHPPNPTNP